MAKHDRFILGLLSGIILLLSGTWSEANACARQKLNFNANWSFHRGDLPVAEVT